MHILVDFDGVLAEFCAAMCQIHYEKTGEMISPEEIKEYDHKIYNDVWNELSRPRLYEIMKPVSQATETMHKLRQNHVLEILTHRPKSAVKETLAWLTKFDVPFHYFSAVDKRESKYNWYGDILIDDHPEVCANFVKNTLKPALCFRPGAYSTNILRKTQFPLLFTIVETWENVEGYISKC